MIDVSYVLAGALTGFVVGLTGVGGGAMMTPILLLFFNVAPVTAVATDLWFASITKLVAAKAHHKSGKIDWQIVKHLWSGSLPVAIITVALIHFGMKFQKVSWLTEAIGFLIVLTAIGLIASPLLLKRIRPQTENTVAQPEAIKPKTTVFAGATLGLCVALTSVGAGALGSVLLMYLYPRRMQPHTLVASDIVHAIPLALVAGIGYAFTGMVDGHMLVSLLIGSLPAVLLGSLLATKLSSRLLQTSLALVLLMVGVRTLV